jgi:uncharacterized membrane protein (UPF0182 family)
VSARRRSLWRTPRARSLLLLGTLVAVGAGLSLAAHLYTDLLWYRELGQESVFWTTLKWRILGRGVPGFGTAWFLFINFAVVERVMAARAPARRERRLVYPVAAVVAGLIAARWHGDAAWRLLALWSGRSDFGVEDPLFHRDVGFFVFSLPLYQQAARWMLYTLAVTGAATIAAYVATGGLRRAPPYVIVRAARAHLLVLGALALIVLAWRYRLDQFALEVPHRGSAVPGASYTDAHVRVPTFRVLSLLALAGAGACLYAAWRRVSRLAVATVAAFGVLAVAGLSVLPDVVERVDVEPQQLSRETPYIVDAIASTRRAFGLDRIGVRILPGGDRLSRRDVARSRRTVANVPLWDARVLRPLMNDLQSIGRYYSFPSTTIDRYTIAGVEQLVAVGARQLNRGRLRPDARGWAHDRFAYTHGYGVVAARVGRTDAEGRPRFPEQGFGSGSSALGLREPRVYFGERPGVSPPYIVVRTRRAEVDEPISGSRTPGYHYGGTGGIPLSNPLRRLAFSARFGDARLLLTETVDSGSRIILHRNARDRLRTLAPFLRWDAHPQTAVIDGRVQFLFHGYTTSRDYPYAAPVTVGRDRVNYMRAGAQAAVDAFSGTVRIYTTDPDPILRAWQAAYPSLFLPASRMPAEMRAHLRYPKALFAAQIDAYATYHADDPTGFWNAADAWQRPLELAGPIEGAGEIRFPAAGPDRAHREIQPDYLYARLPGDPDERLMLVTPFSPRGRENLVAYLAGTVDASGRSQLSLLSLPRDRLTVGPSQATRRVLANPAVSRRLELLNRESRDLGKAAVTRTILGVARSVPIGRTLVHVQPVYVVAGGDGAPRLQLVTVYVDGRVGYGRDLAGALRRAVGPARRGA